MQCPICKSSIPESPDARRPPTFPFCSERCKLIDLGRWLSGKYQIPVDEPDNADVFGGDEAPADDSAH